MRRPGPKDALCSLLAFAYSLPAWAYPFGNDQALHWYLGKRWLEGELPFVSGISSKPIGMFAVHALSTAIMGNGMWPVRVTESFTVLLIGWLIALAVRPLGQPARDGEMGLATLLFSGIYYTFFDYWDTAHPETWESAFALGAWVVALRAEKPWSRDAGAGALATASFMFKFPAALPALGIAALCALRAVREDPREPGALGIIKTLLRAAGRFLTGVAPVVVLVVLPFAIGGKLGVMWEILGVYIPHYAGQAPPVKKLPTWMRVEHGGLVLVATALFSMAAFAVFRERRDRSALFRFGWLLLAFVLSFGSVAMQKRYFTYHFCAMTPFIVALILLGISALRRSADAAPSWPLLAGALFGLSLAYLYGPLWTGGRNQSYRSYTKALVGYLRGEVKRDDLLRPFVGPRPLDSPVFTEHMAAKINALKQPGDTLCTRGFLTPLYPLTGLRCTTRHIVEDNVAGGLPDWPREYKTTLEKHPPTFMVTFGDRQRDIKYLQGRGYKLVGQEGLFRLLSLRPAKAPGAPAGRAPSAPTSSGS